MLFKRKVTMSNIVKKWGLFILSLCPIPSVSFAATAQGNDLYEKMVSDKAETWNSILEEKNQLFQPLTVRTDLNAAYQRFLSLRTANINDPDSDFRNLVDSLQKRGMIEQNGAELVSLVPSYIGPE
jgi:hypothetical protein